MVEVYSYLVVAYLEYHTVETHAFFVLQGDDGALLNVLCVKLAVDAENALLQFHDALLEPLAVGFFRLQREVESLALGQRCNLFLEGRQGYAHAAHEDELPLVGGLLYKF